MKLIVQKSHVIYNEIFPSKISILNESDIYSNASYLEWSFIQNLSRNTIEPYRAKNLLIISKLQVRYTYFFHIQTTKTFSADST